MVSLGLGCVRVAEVLRKRVAGADVRGGPAARSGLRAEQAGVVADGCGGAAGRGMVQASAISCPPGWSPAGWVR